MFYFVVLSYLKIVQQQERLNDCKNLGKHFSRTRDKHLALLWQMVAGKAKKQISAVFFQKKTIGTKSSPSLASPVGGAFESHCKPFFLIQVLDFEAHSRFLPELTSSVLLLSFLLSFLFLMAVPEVMSFLWLWCQNLAGRRGQRCRPFCLL